MEEFNYHLYFLKPSYWMSQSPVYRTKAFCFTFFFINLYIILIAFYLPDDNWDGNRVDCLKNDRCVK